MEPEKGVEPAMETQVKIDECQKQTSDPDSNYQGKQPPHIQHLSSRRSTMLRLV